MNSGRCPIHCGKHHKYTRRNFIRQSAGLLAAPALLAGCSSSARGPMKTQKPILAAGPASKYKSKIKAAFVRRKEDYGMLWPGAVYDGHAARKMYTEKMTCTAKQLGIEFDLRSDPIFSLAEAQNWIATAEEEKVDGLFLVVLDRQKHAWPTAQKVAASSIPSIIYSPLGTSFTTNTVHLAETPGCLVYSTNNFSQAAFGMKMIDAAAKMRRTRCVVIKGAKRYDAPLADLGITLRHVPATTFIEQYNNTPETPEILAMADDYIRRARRQTGAARSDVINGVKSYYVAGKILEAEQADAITMDCLGALGGIDVSLPCIAWSRMNDDGIPAVCEADYGAVAAQIITQYLFDKPGFQQDPVADTADDTIIGAHCSRPTALNGFATKPEPFDLMHHHGARDAVPRTIWKVGQRITSFDVFPGGDPAFGATASKEKRSSVIISAGTVVENIDVPPSGGCVVSVKVKFDGSQEILTFPGFHQIFFYGNHKDQLRDFCQLCNLEARVV
ncbi:MAG: hypothetical protein JW720_07960 [Sedimentisphaerales bacterium]|nr:hypothetical protein [Sedimentisphaerales bacterium]